MESQQVKFTQRTHITKDSKNYKGAQSQMIDTVLKRHDPDSDVYRLLNNHINLLNDELASNNFRKILKSNLHAECFTSQQDSTFEKSLGENKIFSL